MNKISLPAFKQNLINLKHNWQKNKFDPTFYFKFLIVTAFAPVLLMVSLTEDVEANMAKKSVFKKGLLKNALDKIKDGNQVYFNHDPIANPMALDGVSQTAGLQMMLLSNGDAYLFKKNNNNTTDYVTIKKSNVYNLEQEEQGYSVLLSYLLKQQTIRSVSHVKAHLDKKFNQHNCNYEMIQKIKETLSVNEEKSYFEKTISTVSDKPQMKTKRNKI